MKRALIAFAALWALVAWSGPSPVAAQSADDASSGMSCVDCHEDVVQGMTKQIHMRIEPFEVGGRVVGCEGCHGDGARHMEAGGDASLIKTFEPGSGAAPASSATRPAGCRSGTRPLTPRKRSPARAATASTPRRSRSPRASSATATW